MDIAKPIRIGLGVGRTRFQAQVMPATNGVVLRAVTDGRDECDEQEVAFTKNNHGGIGIDRKGHPLLRGLPATSKCSCTRKEFYDYSDCDGRRSFHLWTKLPPRTLFEVAIFECL